VLDNGNVIFEKRGYNQINVSHFLFRCNQGLKDGPPEGKEEVKHNYVIQAIFDLSLWPECKTVNDETDGVGWCLKFYTSETLALIKDTDKEDREKALKASWETQDPGRAEKASKSRQRYLLLKKQKAGEELTEEELELLKEKRERMPRRTWKMQHLWRAKPRVKRPPRPTRRKTVRVRMLHPRRWKTKTSRRSVSCPNQRTTSTTTLWPS
jgi:hypothetical protein